MNYELREFASLQTVINKHENSIDTIYDKICKYINDFDKLHYQDKVRYLNDFIKECIWDGNTLAITI